MSRILILKQFFGKTLTEIKAYGTDRFDFTPNLLGVDFSVGQFGYAVFSFGKSNIYISADGLSTIVPPKNNAKALPIEQRIRDHFVGAVLEMIEYDGETYWIQFAGFEVLRGRFVPNDGYTDRSYFELEFPWV